jgi:XTP/dITP diphosphohydrolase
VARLVLLVTSPRLPAGLLTAEAWDMVRAYPVFATAETDLTAALRAAGARIELIPLDAGLSHAATLLLGAVAEHGDAVWLAGPRGDEPLARELGLRLAREPGRAELELCYGSWDPPGARLLDVVTIMDRLVSPGGDPWKREQTHQTLARYLLEEAYEAYDAIDAHDLAALREELGDVLLQVVLHARMAEEADQPWTVDDVAATLVEKLVRRNPHVFAGVEVTGVDEIIANWERIKQEERGTASVLDGIAWGQPALALAAKILHRMQRAGRPLAQPPADAPADEADLGAALFALVAAAVWRGLDPEAALRRETLAQAEAVRSGEETQVRSSEPPAGSEPPEPPAGSEPPEPPAGSEPPEPRRPG